MLELCNLLHGDHFPSGHVYVIRGRPTKGFVKMLTARLGEAEDITELLELVTSPNRCCDDSSAPPSRKSFWTHPQREGWK